MADTARRTALATLVVVAIVVLALVLGMLFFAFIIAAAIRPGIEWLARHRVPRVAGLALHYLAILGAVAAALSFAVPRAIDQVDTALSPSGKAQIAKAARNSSGVKHQLLTALRKRL